MTAGEQHRADVVLVVGPPLAGTSSVAAALRGRLVGCEVVEAPCPAPDRIPDAVVFVTSAAAPISDCEAALFAAATGRTDAVVAAVAKIDVHRSWRTVLDLNRSALPRAVPWVGVAADPDIGATVIGPLVDAVRAELDDEHRRRRNLLRAREWTLQRRIAEREREAAMRAVRRARAARRSAVRVRIQQARLQLAGQARAQCATLRSELQGAAAAASRRELDSFDGLVRRRAQQVADEFDSAVAERIADISTTAGMAVPALPPPPVQSYLPSPRRAAQEDRLAAVFGTGFGIGVALTLGRLLAAVVPAAMPAVVPVCAAAGVALATWVVSTRRLVTARVAMDRWAAEVAAAVRTALEERLMAAESLLLEAHVDVPEPAEATGSATVDPTSHAWIGELGRIRAELHGPAAPNPDHRRPELSHNAN